MTIEKDVTLHPEFSLHARPAAMFIQTAKKYDATVRVRKDGREVDARSAIGLMSLDAGKGSTITLHAEGNQAQEVVAALEKLVMEAG